MASADVVPEVAVSTALVAVWQAAAIAVSARYQVGALVLRDAPPAAMDAATTDMSNALNTLLTAVRELDAVLHGAAPQSSPHLC